MRGRQVPIYTRLVFCGRCVSDLTLHLSSPRSTGAYVLCMSLKPGRASQSMAGNPSETPIASSPDRSSTPPSVPPRLCASFTEHPPHVSTQNHPLFFSTKNDRGKAGNCKFCFGLRLKSKSYCNRREALRLPRPSPSKELVAPPRRPTCWLCYIYLFPLQPSL